MKTAFRLLCTAYIFLCAPFSINAQQARDLTAEALEWERVVYAADDAATVNSALFAKAECRKQEGLYADAVAELDRVRLFALDSEGLAELYYQKTLCSYLAGEFTLAASTVDEMKLYVTDSAALNRMQLLEVLVRNETGEWDKALGELRLWAERSVPDSLRTDFLADMERAYKHTPHRKNPRTAYWLSLLPGLGQLYAGAPRESLVSFVANGGLAAFGVSEVMAGYYLGAWIVSGGLLSSTYFVGMERASALAERHNRKAMRRYNDDLRREILAAAER